MKINPKSSYTVYIREDWTYPTVMIDAGGNGDTWARFEHNFGCRDVEAAKFLVSRVRLAISRGQPLDDFTQVA